MVPKSTVKGIAFPPGVTDGSGPDFSTVAPSGDALEGMNGLSLTCHTPALAVDSVVFHRSVRDCGVWMVKVSVHSSKSPLKRRTSMVVADVTSFAVGCFAICPLTV